MVRNPNPPDAPRRRRRRAPSRTVAWALAAVVLFAGLGATFWAVRADGRDAIDQDAERLARVARNRAVAIADAVNDDLVVLQATAAFQAANDRDMAAFAAFMSRLDLSATPGLAYISYIVPVTPDEVAALEAQRHAAGQLGFRVDPGPVDDRYHVILFSGPNPGRTDGVDVGQVDILPPALERAADSGRPVVTDPFVRIQDRNLPPAEQQLSVALYVPVYAPGAGTATVEQRRAALIGWTASAVPVHSLVSALGVTGAAEVRLAVRDTDDRGVDIAAVPAPAPSPDADRATAGFDVADQRWEVEAATLPSFDRTASSAVEISLAGALASAAVAALVLNLALQRRRLALRVREAVAQAAASQGRFRAAFDNAPVGVVVLGYDGSILDFNPAMIRMLGEPSRRQLSITESIPAEDLPTVVEHFERLGSGAEDHLVVENELVRADGSRFWARITSAALRDQEAIVALIHDVTAERAAAEAAEELRSRRARFEALVRHSSDLITVMDPDRKVLYASPAVGALIGITPEEAVGADAIVSVHPDDRDEVGAALDVAMASPGVHGPMRYRIVGAGDVVRVVEATITNLLDDPDVGGIVANCRDVTLQEHAAEALRQRAYSDQLTGLATRDVVLDRLAVALDNARRNDATVALLFVDLDRFKQVNDRFGHAAGDSLLIAVADAISEAVRPGDMAARHGGDEFVVLLESVRGEREARAVAERVRAALRHPVVIDDGVVVEPGASVGVALSDGSTTPEAMLRDADAALYRAKQAGRDRVELFDDELRQRAVRRLDTELVLRQSLEDDAIDVRFEPVADLVDGSLVGAEARVRLALPSGEQVPFAELLPVAQEAGLAPALASEALSAACRAVVAWSARTGEPRWVGLDVSAGEVTHPTFIERLTAVLGATGVEAGALRLELPVEVVTHGTALTRRAIEAARALGVRVVLDGVGAELRALAALGSFGVDGLKLDLAALPDPVGDSVAAAVAASVGEVAAAAGLPVVVVGANRAEQLDVVRNLGFRYVQGAAVAPMLGPVDLVELGR